MAGNTQRQLMAGELRHVLATLPLQMHHQRDAVLIGLDDFLGGARDLESFLGESIPPH